MLGVLLSRPIRGSICSDLNTLLNYTLLPMRFWSIRWRNHSSWLKEHGSCQRFCCWIIVVANMLRLAVACGLTAGLLLRSCASSKRQPVPAFLHTWKTFVYFDVKIQSLLKAYYFHLAWKLAAKREYVCNVRLGKMRSTLARVSFIFDTIPSRFRLHSMPLVHPVKNPMTIDWSWKDTESETDDISWRWQHWISQSFGT